jgi:putative transcriptional regulator
MNPAAGMVLVSSPSLIQPAFLRTVVYLVEHNTGEGTLGFIVNRPLDVALKDLWTECPVGLSDLKIAADGGPVERDKGLLIHSCLDLPGAQAMGQGLAIGGELDALAERYATGSDETGPRLFLGRSGWMPGQLENEIKEGAWIVRPGSIELLLNRKPAAMLWQTLLEGHGGLPEPSIN